MRSDQIIGTHMKEPAVKEKADGNHKVSDGEVVPKVVPIYVIGAMACERPARARSCAKMIIDTTSASWKKVGGFGNMKGDEELEES